jgi:hypothetical protein
MVMHPLPRYMDRTDILWRPLGDQLNVHRLSRITCSAKPKIPCPPPCPSRHGVGWLGRGICFARSNTLNHVNITLVPESANIPVNVSVLAPEWLVGIYEVVGPGPFVGNQEVIRIMLSRSQGDKCSRELEACYREHVFWYYFWFVV